MICHTLTVFQLPDVVIHLYVDQRQAHVHIDQVAAVCMDQLALGTVSLVGSRLVVLVFFGQQLVWLIVL